MTESEALEFVQDLNQAILRSEELINDLTSQLAHINNHITQLTTLFNK